jgi:hypothetical protein
MGRILEDAPSQMKFPDKSAIFRNNPLITKGRTKDFLYEGTWLKRSIKIGENKRMELSAIEIILMIKLRSVVLICKL